MLKIESYDDLALNRDLSKVSIGVEITFELPPELKSNFKRLINMIDWPMLSGLRSRSLRF